MTTSTTQPTASPTSPTSPTASPTGTASPGDTTARRGSTRSRTGLAAVAVLAVVALAGCGSEDASRAEDPGTGSASGAAAGLTDVATYAPDPEDAYTVLEQPTLQPGEPVPAPRGKVVLTITGGTTHNDGDALSLDLDLLDRMGSVTMEVDDSMATGGRQRFSGPLLSYVLEVAGATEGSTLHTVAINDYEVDIPMEDVRTLPVLLATRMGNRTMSVAQYGPTRVVYPTDQYDLDGAVYEPRWIWQLSSVDVRP